MHDLTTDFLEHLLSLRRAVLSARAELILAGDTLEALIRLGDRHWRLEPQFFSIDAQGTVRFAPLPPGPGSGFSGWLAERSERQPLSVTNLEFRELARAAGLPVPASGRDPSAVAGPVVVRSAGPTLGPRFRGPFRSASERPLDAASGDFYEQLPSGDALTVWFWEGKPVCAEREIAPTVTGDGTSSVLALALRSPSARVRRAAARSPERDAFLRFHEISLDTVLPAGKVQVLDFPHALRPIGSGESAFIDLTGPAGAPWLGALRAAGEAILGAALPPEARAGSLFAVDALVSGDALRLLGTDANPHVHPALYATMVRSLTAHPPSAAVAPRA